MASKTKGKGTLKSQEEQNPVEENAAVEKRPTKDEIEHRAYEIYLERGGTHGHDIDDWLQAERELTDIYCSGQ